MTSVTVLPADEEPAATPATASAGVDENTAADWLPGIRDEHDDDDGLAGPLARPADVGSDGDAEHPEADRPAAGTPPLTLAGAGRST